MVTKNSIDAHVVELWGLATTAYDGSRNPLFLWEAFLLARRHKLEVPPPVLEYFERCARALLKPNQHEKGGTPDAHIAAALEMKEGNPPNVYRRRAEYMRDIGIEVDVHLGGKSVVQAAAERHRDPTEFARKRAQRSHPAGPRVRKRRNKSKE